MQLGQASNWHSLQWNAGISLLTLPHRLHSIAMFPYGLFVSFKAWWWWGIEISKIQISRGKQNYFCTNIVAELSNGGEDGGGMDSLPPAKILETPPPEIKIPPRNDFYCSPGKVSPISPQECLPKIPPTSHFPMWLWLMEWMTDTNL